jgi:hypothetical protein
MGLAALHILHIHQYPTFFYGQNYLGTIEAYVGAVNFSLFGASVFAQRIGLVLIYVLFLIATYALASIVYDKRTAIVSVVFLALGSDSMLLKQLEAAGGYAEIEFLGSLLFLLSSWLAITARDHRTLASARWRRSLFFAWGLASGLALWSDLLILPIVAMAGMLLGGWCRSELLRRPGFYMLLGLLLGAFPLIKYNVSAAPGQDSLHVLLAQTGSPRAIMDQILGLVLVSFPTATGGMVVCPIAPASAWPLSSHSSTYVHGCTRPGRSASSAYGSWRSLMLQPRCGSSPGTVLAKI